MPSVYASLTARTQVRRLRGVARSALAAWGLADAELRLRHHGYNTTFSVRTPGGPRYALRINVNAHKEPAHLDAELAWLEALARDTGLRVPRPLPTRDGDAYALVHSPGHGRRLPAVLFTWLPGRHPSESSPTRAQMLALGRTTALLHTHAETWRMPPGVALPRIDTVLMNVPDRLTGGHSALPPGGREVIAEAMRVIQAGYDALLARSASLPLHADLHAGNLLWDAGRLGVLDFDDAGVGVRAQDLAISAYYLRDDPRAEEWLLEGYASERALPEASTAEFEAVVASRNLVLANDLVAAENAELRALVERYLVTTVARMRHFLATGRYVAQAPGVVPLG